VAKIEIIPVGELFLGVSSELIQIFEQHTKQYVNMHAAIRNSICIVVFWVVGGVVWRVGVGVLAVSGRATGNATCTVRLTAHHSRTVSFAFAFLHMLVPSRSRLTLSVVVIQYCTPRDDGKGSRRHLQAQFA
jgi:hypothetical protein